MVKNRKLYCDGCGKEFHTGMSGIMYEGDFILCDSCCNGDHFDLNPVQKALFTLGVTAFSHEELFDFKLSPRKVQQSMNTICQEFLDCVHDGYSHSSFDEIHTPEELYAAYNQAFEEGKSRDFLLDIYDEAEAIYGDDSVSPFDFDREEFEEGLDDESSVWFNGEYD